MLKKIYLFLVGVLVMSVSTSCLHSGLDDIEDSNLCELISISMEYRWLSTNANGYDQLSRQQLTLSKNSPEEDGNLYFSITVPAASASFPEDVRDNVSLDNLYMIANISPAASIKPIGNAPKLGLPAKWVEGQDYTYQVTAANGESKQYHLKIENFVK